MRLQPPKPEDVWSLFLTLARNPPTSPTDDEASGYVHFAHKLNKNDKLLAGIQYTGKTADAYGAAVAQLRAATSWGRHADDRALLKVAQRFLIEHSRATGPDVKVIEGKYKAEFLGALQKPTSPWRVALPCIDFHVDDKTVRVAGLSFRKPSKATFAELRAQVRRQAQGNANARTLFYREIEYLGRAPTIVLLDVEARDANAAVEVARRLYAERMELLSFVAGAMELRVRNKVGRESRSAPAISFERALPPGVSAGSLRMGSRDVPLNQPTLSIQDVYAYSAKLPYVRRAMRIATNATRTDCEDRLFRSLRWLGRSMRATHQTTQLLEAAIAWESLMIGDQRGGITHTLALRTAQLLERGYPRGKLVYEQAKELYKLRSQVVHVGTECENHEAVEEMQRLAARSAYAFYKQLMRLGTTQRVDDWFRARMF